MYLIVYQTQYDLKARFLTTHVFYNPGDYTPGGWKVLSVGYYFNKKFIDKKLYSDYLNRSRHRHLKRIYLKDLLSNDFNKLLKLLLFIFLLKELIYKFFIYMLS